MNEDSLLGDLLFEVLTPLGFSVRVTRSYKEGFLLTAYPAEAIKEGELIWPK